MIGKDIIATADFLSKEHNLSEDVVFGAIETALAISAKKDYDPSGHIELECEIDRENGSYSFSQKWTVVDDNEKNFESAKHLYDDQAEELYGREVEIGEVFTKFLSKDKPLSRICAQVFKNTIKEEIRMAIKLNAQEKFTHRVGEIFKVSVSRFMKSDILVSIDDDIEGVIKKQGLQRKDKLTIGQTLDVVLVEIVENYKGQQLIFDRANEMFVQSVVEQEIPDFEDETIVLKTFARDKFKKTIVSVDTNIPNVDPVSVCIGANGVRVANIRKIIGGEAVEFVRWNEDSATFLGNVFGRKANNISIDEENMEVDVGYDAKSYSLVKNVEIEEKVLSEVTGFTVRIYTNDEFLKKTETVHNYYTTLISENMDLEKEMAADFVAEGFEDFETLAYVQIGEYLDMGFEHDIAMELKSRANEVINKANEAKELNDLRFLSTTYVNILAEKNIHTIEDLAYLSNDELKEEFLDLRSKEIENIIKEAKNVFFKDA